METCKKCKDYIWSGEKHNCREYTIINSDGDETKLYATSEEDAGLRYAEKVNESNDYYLMEDSEDILINGNAYAISAEPSINYSADKKD